MSLVFPEDKVDIPGASSLTSGIDGMPGTPISLPFLLFSHHQLSPFSLCSAVLQAVLAGHSFKGFQLFFISPIFHSN